MSIAKRMKNVCTELDGAITSPASGSRPSRPSSPFRRVAVRFTLAGDVGAIAGLLAGLEYENHFTVPFMELNRRGALGAPNAPRTINATIEVAGFVPSGDGGAEAAAVDDTFVGPPWPPPEEKPAPEGTPPAEGAPGAEGA